MGQHAGLGRNLVALDDRVEHLQQGADRGHAVGGRIDPEHRVAIAEQQAVEDARGDSGRVVGRVVRLQAGGEPAAKAEGVAEAGDHADLLRHQDQVLDTHDLRYRRCHFRRQARSQGAQAGLVGGVAEQPVAEAADGEMGHRGEGVALVGVDDQAGDLVVLVGNQRLVEEVFERDVGQGHLRGDPLAVVARRDAGEEIAGARGAGLGHHVLEAVEAVGFAADAMGETCHVCLSARPRHAAGRALSCRSQRRSCSAAWIAANSSSGVPDTR